MKSCHDVDAIMTAYIDGESEPQETAAVDSHLAVCPPCRDRAMAEQAIRDVMRGRASRLGERASPALRARCVAATPESPTARQASTPPPGLMTGPGIQSSQGRYRSVRGWVPLSMAATVLLAIGAVFFVGQDQKLEAAFAAQLAIDHDRCFQDLDPATAEIDEQRAERLLARDFGLDVTVPGESDDFDVVDVRKCLYDEGQMAHLLCEWRGERVSLFIVPDRADREHDLEIVDHDAVIWSQNGNTYVLVTEKGPVELGPLTDYVRWFTD